MLKWYLHRETRKFARAFNYDATYLHEIIDAAPGAALRFSFLPMINRYRSDAPLELWAGASLASILDGDCGPCAQLTIDFALHQGVRADIIQACIRRDLDAAGAAGLGFRFAEAAIAGAPNLDDLRTEIETAYGKRAVISVTFAAATSRVYPVIKRGLGHGKACQRLMVGEATENWVPQAA